MKNAKIILVRAYLCPICSQMHTSEDQSPPYLETWKETCPNSDLRVNITNEYFIDHL